MKLTTIIPVFLLIFCSALSYGQMRELKNDLKKIIRGKDATVAVSVEGIEDAFQLNINGNKHLPMLSVFKFHIGIAVLHEVDRGKLNLDQKIFIKKSDLLPNTWSPILKKYPIGDIEMSLREVLQYTVAESDNNGCDLLLKLLGGTEQVEKFFMERGVKNLQIKANEEKMHQGYELMYLNWTTANSASQLLKDFYNGKFLSKTSTDFLMKTMLDTTTGANKIVSQLPNLTKVAHKTGSSGKDYNGLTIAENDIGIVTLPNGKHYAISIFVTNSMESEETNTKMIADLSSTVFDYFNKRKTSN